MGNNIAVSVLPPPATLAGLAFNAAGDHATVTQIQDGWSFESIGRDPARTSKQIGQMLQTRNLDLTPADTYVDFGLDGDYLKRFSVTGETIAFYTPTGAQSATLSAAGFVMACAFTASGVCTLLDDGVADCGIDAPGCGGAIRWNSGSTSFRLNDGNGTQVLHNQEAAIANPAGGATVDANARATIVSILSALRAHGIIAT